MKSRVMSEGKAVICPKCKNDIWRLTVSKNKYINKSKTAGVYWDMRICDKCGYRKILNETFWVKEGEK